MSRHQCLIYEGSPTEHLRSLARSIKQNLGEGRRCLFLHGPAMVAGMRYYLADAGVDPMREATRGALVLTSDVSHLVDGHFDIDRMIAMLADTVERALADGYQGLFATGDMTWEFGDEKSFVKLLEYEHALEELFQKTPALRGVCQYCADTLPANAIQDALLSHPAVYINETLARINPSYSPTATAAPESSSMPPMAVKATLKRAHFAGA